MFRKRKILRHVRERISIDTDAAFTDSINLPGFDRGQLEGRVVRQLHKSEAYLMGALFSLFVIAALARAAQVQIFEGKSYAARSEANRLTSSTIFAERGVITDRYGEKLAWNVRNEAGTDNDPLFPQRVYSPSPAFSHLLGYVEYPKQDAAGNWWRSIYIPKGGVELAADEVLRGVNGSTIMEVDARGNATTQTMVDPPKNGETVALTLDAQLTKRLYETVKNGVERSHFRGGASVIIDVTNGDIVAMTSYPSYDLNAFMRKDDQALIKSYLTDQRSVMMDRAYQGAYAPGSIVKPYMAIAALQEGVVTPEWGIVSTGSISIPNPYNPAKPFIFRDWKAHGFVDMRRAIGVSSDVYFYAVGGGYGGQRGMGIAAIEKWGKAFGFGQETGFDLPGEAEGQIPSPEWKAQTFPKDTRWTIGNTYHASIGQYGWLATPMQAVRYTAAVANYGTLWQPHLIQGEDPVGTPVGADKKNIEVAHDGMRNSATYGTAKSLNIPGFDLAGKTGTAEVGAHNEKMHSWVIGFWPSHHPKFAFVTMYENGKAGTMVGAAPSMRPFFEQLLAEHSPYMRGEYPSQDSRKPQEQEAAALDDASSGAPTTQDVVTPSDLESPANTAPLEVPTIAPPAPAQATPSQGAISAPTTIAPLSVPATPGAATSQ